MSPVAGALDAVVVGTTVHGYRLDLIKSDDRCAYESHTLDDQLKANVFRHGRSAVIDLVADPNTVAVVSACPWDSSRAEFLEGFGVPSIALLGSKEKQNKFPSSFALDPTNEQRAAALALYAAQRLGVRTAAIITTARDLAHGEMEAITSFKRELARNGGTISDDIEVGLKDADFQAALRVAAARIARLHPDAVYAGALLSGTYSQDGEHLIGRFLRDAGWNGNLLTVTSGLVIDPFIDQRRFPLPITVPGGVVAADSRQYVLAGGLFNARAADAATTIVRALESASSVTPDGLVVDLRTLSDKIREQSFSGAAGPLSFDIDGNRSSPLSSFSFQRVGTTTVDDLPAIDNRQMGSTQNAVIARVIDGDTIDVLLEGRQERVRFILVDTPEISGRVECFGREAAAFASAILPPGIRIALEKDVSERDQYGRLLRYVYLPDGRMVNELLTVSGYARLATFPPDVKYVERMRAAEARARTDGVGLWGACP